MAKKDQIKYWLKSADQDWSAANHLFEKKDYTYALFFSHLTLEKILKAIFTDKQDYRFRNDLVICIKEVNAKS